MKTYKIDEEKEIDFLILGINSHIKPYKLCWEINNNLKLNFIKNEYHKPEENKGVEFSRFTSENKDLEIDESFPLDHCVKV